MLKVIGFVAVVGALVVLITQSGLLEQWFGSPAPEACAADKSVMAVITVHANGDMNGVKCTV